MIATEGEVAVIDTPIGRLRGRNTTGVSAGSKAILFVRPEALRLGAGQANCTIQAPVVSVAFEGNMSHVFLKGPGRKDIVATIGRDETQRLPGQGDTATLHFPPSAGILLPLGRLASE